MPIQRLVVHTPSFRETGHPYTYDQLLHVRYPWNVTISKGIRADEVADIGKQHILMVDAVCLGSFKLNRKSRVDANFAAEELQVRR